MIRGLTNTLIQRTTRFNMVVNLFNKLSLTSNNGHTDSTTTTSTSSSESSPTTTPDPRDCIVQTPPDDDISYRALTLNNGMHCLLVSDGDTTKSENSSFRAHKNIDSIDKAAACLTVRVGSAHEPREIPGLAHFLEHMLFMGCKKYPNENEYDEYLDKFGGSSNASTDYENTSYVFDVSAEGLQGALDRLAHQFIAPLLKRSSVGREVKAVDSEYMMGLQSDAERREAITISLLDSHPFKIFSAGNKQSLVDTPRRNNIDTMRELTKFYEQYYSANIMCLCVQSPDTLDKLEDMVQIFEKIPNRNIPLPTFESHPIPKQRCNFIKYNPVKDRTKLFVDWFLPSQMQHYRSKPDEHVEWCVAHEGTGSLLAELKRQGLATSLTAGVGAGGLDNSSNFSRFSIEIDLSSKGLEHYRDVILLTFQYLAMLKLHLPVEWIYEEMKKMHQIDFDYMENEDAYDNVENLSDNMTMFAEEHYVSGSELLFEYRPDLITEVLNAMTPEAMFVVLQSQTFAEECTSIEPWYQGTFKECSFEPRFIQALSCTGPGNFHLPARNLYIPEDFKLKDIDVEGPPAAPVVISDDPKFKIWYHKDEVFEQPECMMYWHIFCEKMGVDMKTFALNSLYAELCGSRSAELFYPASLAGLAYQIKLGREGWILKFDGYSDKMFKFFSALLQEFANSSANVFNFQAIKDSMVKETRMATIRPKKLADEIRQRMLRLEYYSSEEMATALESITAEDIKNHKISSTGGFYIESLCGGNVTSTEVEEYLARLRTSLGDEVMPRERIRQIRVYKVPPGRWLYRTKNRNPDDVNTVVVNYYQHDIVKFRDTVILRVVETLMSEPMFNQLRTRLQLGYNVSVSDHETYGVTGFSLTVCSQASKFTASAINVYIEKFLIWFKGYLAAMSEDVFEARVSEIIKDKLTPFINIDDEMEQMWQEILLQEYIFDRDERVANVLKELTLGEVQSFVHNLFHRNVRKISVQVEGNPDGRACNVESESESENDEDDSDSDSDEDEVTVPNMKPLNQATLKSYSEEMTVVQSIDEFHKKCKLLPVYKLKSQIVTVDATNMNRT